MDVGLFDRLRYAIFGWKDFPYPKGDPLPARPWHPDGDEFYTEVPATKMADSAAHIDWLDRTGRFIIHTGDSRPNSGGKVSGVRINLARPTDPVFTISRHLGEYQLAVTTGYTAPYGAKVRCQPKRMFLQGNPMQAYSDSKLHTIEYRDGTWVVTEIQNLRPATYPWLACDGVKQYTVDVPSLEAEGSCAAKLSLIGHTLRYDDVMAGYIGRASMAVAMARHTWIHPARGSDGFVGGTRRGSVPDDPAAPPMGTILRVTPETRQRLDREYPRGKNPQLHAVLDSYAGPGIVIVDTGGNNSTSLEPDPRWDQRQLAPLRALTARDFEAWQL